MKMEPNNHCHGHESECFGFIDVFKSSSSDAPYQTFKLTRRTVRIGRDHSNDIRIHNLKISRLQCTLTILGSPGYYQVLLKNKTDKPTTMVGNRSIPPQGEVIIYSGERFRCRKVELRYRDNMAVDSEDVDR